VFHEGHESDEAKNPDEFAPIPAVAVGDTTSVLAVTPNQHFTEPPPRFSEASLVKKLEELGIGRPSTYAAIISTLRDRWYATAKDRRFSPTPQGEMVWKVMRRSFPEVFDVGFTARMENELDKVEDGDLEWRAVLTEFWGPFASQLAAVDIEAIIHEVHDLSKLADERCPECESKLIVKSGRFGPYLACERYPDPCSYSRSLRNKVPDKPTDLLCPKCGAPLVIKTGRYGEFLACTQYPKCKHTQPVPLGIKCPQCGTGDIAERRTRRGRNFWGCLRYPDCDYSTWNQPVAVACPSCGFVGMEQKQTKAAGTTRKCMKCAHEEQVEDAVPVESAAN
jgi:DNA topoisomerase-1